MEASGITAKVTLQLNGKVKVLVVFRILLLRRSNCEPRVALSVCASTKVRWCKVADACPIGAPLAGLINRDSLGVDVVLCAGRVALPLIVGTLIRARKRAGNTRLGVQRDSLVFGTYRTLDL